MSASHDFGWWLSVSIRVLLILAPPGVLIWKLLANIAAHSVCLSGQRVRSDENGPIRYRFAIQNNEDVPLTGKRRLLIRVLDPAAHFLRESPPRVYAGCNPIRTSLDPALKSWSMNFDELPALETWTIVCDATEHAHNTSLTVEDIKAPEPSGSERADREGKKAESGDPKKDRRSSDVPAPRLSHSRLTLTADKGSVFEGRSTTPEPWWATVAAVLALLVYWISLYLWVYRRYGQFSPSDLAAPAAICLFSFVVWRLTRRPAPSISQGYWTPSRQTPMLEPPSESSANDKEGAD